MNPATPDAAPFLLLSDGAWAATALQDELSRRTLAVLSTCSSGSGRNYQGEGVMSIAHAFLGAGTKAVVHTLWPVDDRATSEILRDFYNGLQEGLPASEALARSKTDFIARHAADGLADPFYWSGIVLTGTDVHLGTVGQQRMVVCPECAADTRGQLHAFQAQKKIPRLGGDLSVL
ncbi:MAG: CHAT domain-containing protein [Flavobacteriales bacterium]|nr:CHAT domain-containing protein [Flavobacteriales bacterium]